jgi:hypothetical protein
MDVAMVMMPKKGVPRDGAMGGSMGSTSATKPVAVAVWFDHKEPALLSTPHPRSDPQDLGGKARCQALSGGNKGAKLSQEEIKALIKDWLTSRYPATCPHSRSICYRIDHKDIARKRDRH